MPPPAVTDPDLYQSLNRVVALDDAEVYSWFPEPEYDPHLSADDDASVMEEEETLQEEDEIVAMDLDEPTSYNAGMEVELEDVPSSAPMLRTKSSNNQAKKGRGEVANRPKLDEEWGVARDRRKGGLLWSANYFFYSR